VAPVYEKYEKQVSTLGFGLKFKDFWGELISKEINRYKTKKGD